MIRIDDGVLYLPQDIGILLTANVHNVNIGTSPVLYTRQVAASAGITGFNGGEENRLLILQPARNSTGDIIVYDNNAGSSSGNRVINAQRVDDEFGFWGTARMYIYDSVHGFWKQVGGF
jgi:hypothetical protein